MLKMACHFVLGADVEKAGNKNNGGHHEDHTTDLPAHAEFAIPQSPSALDWEECPSTTPLLSQTDRKCVG
jgi:hypothetical protein